jgi:glycine/D-amino acid oxidase-like deaminating enzyme
MYNLNMSANYAIIGGGIVGLSIAHGLLKIGKRVVVFDEGDLAFRASRGNFGLIWVQGKGLQEPEYARWTRTSSSAWADYAKELEEATGDNLALSQNGGFDYHVSEQSLADVIADYEGLKANLGDDYPFDVLDFQMLKKEEPNIGPDVIGAVLHKEDGHVNPLKLLRALSTAVRQLGGSILTNARVDDIAAIDGGYKIVIEDSTSDFAEQVVLCAGLGAATLGPKLGFKAHVHPERGQVLITEKLPPIMNRPSGTLRQVDEGSVQIGASSQDVGLDDIETLDVTANLAKRAIGMFPILSRAKLVRSWSALRIMSPDGLPIYQKSTSHPGVALVTCHSGITLSAAHSRYLPLWLEEKVGAPDLRVFSEARFSV